MQTLQLLQFNSMFESPLRADPIKFFTHSKSNFTLWVGSPLGPLPYIHLCIA